MRWVSLNQGFESYEYLQWIKLKAGLYYGSTQYIQLIYRVFVN